MNLFIFLKMHSLVIAVSVSIVLAAGYFWVFWNRRINQTILELKSVRQHFDEHKKDGRRVIGEAIEKTTDPNIQAILREIQSGLFDLPGDLGIKTYSLRFYQEIWTPRSLLAKRVNLSLYEAAPNILIGIGLLFTFLFLAIALAEVTPALAPNASPDAIRPAIAGLLQNASGKFSTSIVGLLCSLLWTFKSKANLESLEHEIESLCVAMQKHFEDTGSEAAISAQITFLGEILNENREQVGQLRRFETDFAVAIAKALGNQMQPEFERLTTALTTALKEMTEKIGTINEHALKKMLEDFQIAIRELSSKEMNDFKQTLLEIAQQIKDAAEKLKGAGGQVGEDLENAGQQFTTVLAEAASSLQQSASILDQAIINTKATVNDLDDTLERATREGRQGLDNLQSLLGRLSTTASEMSDLLGSIKNTSDTLKSAAANTSQATSNLKDIVNDQSSLVTSVGEAARMLGSSVTTANQEFKSSAQTMANTTKEMSSGIENYSRQLAELHGAMDENLAKAIGSLNGTITELVEGLDDFMEQLGKGRR